MFTHTLILADENSTHKAAQALAQTTLALGTVIYLEGDLGAGKTTFVRAYLRERGFAGTVKSPTYTLVESYTLPKYSLYHFDFYRMNQPAEFLEAGFADYFTQQALYFVEWPQKAKGFLPNADLSFAFQILPKEEGRLLTIHAKNAKWLAAFQSL